MPNNFIIDGALVQWGDRLFYPGNRIVRPPGGVHGGTSLYDRAHAIRQRLHATVVRGAPQVMVKVTGGGRGMAAIAAHFRTAAWPSKMTAAWSAMARTACLNWWSNGAMRVH
jgi:hypothetical protein